jgi:hypothetical protein
MQTVGAIKAPNTMLQRHAIDMVHTALPGHAIEKMEHTPLAMPLIESLPYIKESPYICWAAYSRDRPYIGYIPYISFRPRYGNTTYIPLTGHMEYTS